MGRKSGSIKTPSLRHHKATGQAVVTMDGRDFYLGQYDSPSSKQKYERMIGDWFLRGRQGPAQQPDTATVRTLCAGIIEQAKIEQEIRVDGHMLTAIRWLISHYGDVKTGDIRPLDIKSLRGKMILAKVHYAGREMNRTLSRRYVNRLIQCVKIIFRWGATVDLVPSSVTYAVDAVDSLKRGGGACREGKTVTTIEQKHVDAVLEIASFPIKQMIELQLLTGMRSGEVCQMRAVDIDMSRKVWRYTPEHHKTEDAGQKRWIGIGPLAQEIIRPLLKPDLSAYLFTPLEGFRHKMMVNRRLPKKFFFFTVKTHKRRRSWPRYSSQTYCNAIIRFIRKADEIAHLRNPEIPADQVVVKRWHPHQLRHNAATFIRSKYGLEAARAALGHGSVSMTEIYAENDWNAVEKIAAEVG